MENKMYKTKVELACDLAEAFMFESGINVQWVTDNDGNMSYSESCQRDFDSYYGLVMAYLEGVKVPFSELEGEQCES